MVDVFTQTTYGDPRIGAPGSAAGGDVEKVTAWAMEADLLPGTWGKLDFGASDPGALNRPGVRNLKLNRMTLTFGGNASTGTFTGTLKRTLLDGTSATHAISVPYNTSHTQTMTDIKAAFDAIGSGSGLTILATLTDATNNRQVTVTSVDPSVQLSASVAFGWSSTPTTTTDNASTDTPNTLIGIDWAVEKDINGLVKYARYDDVPAAREGQFYVDGETSMPGGAGTGIYARISPSTGTNQESGKSRSSAGSSPVVAIAVPRAVVFNPTDAAHATYVAEFDFCGT